MICIYINSNTERVFRDGGYRYIRGSVCNGYSNAYSKYANQYINDYGGGAKGGADGYGNKRENKRKNNNNKSRKYGYESDVNGRQRGITNDTTFVYNVRV